MRNIKKYSNRRLYDTVDSRYVNLEDLAALVRQGEQLRVVDAKSGLDLTRDVLLQVVLEAQDGARLFPPGLLHRIIRFGGDHPLQRAALQQIGAGLELLDAQVSQLERAMGWVGGVPGATTRPPGARGGPYSTDPPPPPDMVAEPPDGPSANPPPPGPPPPGPPPPGPPPPGPRSPGPRPPPHAAPPDAAPPDAAAPDADDLDALRARLAALEARLRR